MIEDALPEDTKYKDKGCKLYPKCLECPLEECYYDTEEKLLRINKEVK